MQLARGARSRVGAAAASLRIPGFTRSDSGTGGAWAVMLRLLVSSAARQRQCQRRLLSAPGHAAARRWFSTGVAEAQPVVLLGHPALRVVCEPCGTEDLSSEKAALVATLEAFRQANGFGRGIAAPQIGVTRRFIAVNMGDDHPIVCSPPRVLSDPVVTWRSPETFTLFDDCMSLPWILCAVRRHESISVEFTNEDGERETWSEVDKPLAELLQHELDHLDGVLNLDLALPEGVISREVFDQDPSAFKDTVDYFIEPTI
jgi:peptide deformylase